MFTLNNIIIEEKGVPIETVCIVDWARNNRQFSIDLFSEYQKQYATKPAFTIHLVEIKSIMVSGKADPNHAKNKLIMFPEVNGKEFLKLDVVSCQYANSGLDSVLKVN